MPSNTDMHRIVSEDPVAAVQFFYRTVELALRELFAVRCPFTGDPTPPDGCAASALFGCVGDVDAFFGVTEAQQRGSLHVHLFLWLLAQWDAADLAASLDATFFDEEVGLRARMLRYVEMATQASVDLLPRKFGLPARPDGLPPMMVSAPDAVDPSSDDEQQSSDEEQQAARERFALQCQAADNNAPLTGMAASRLGPPEEGLRFYADYAEEGRDDGGPDAHRWAEGAISDAWDVTADGGLHACRRSCQRKRAVLGIVCRAMFWHLVARGARWLLRAGKATTDSPTHHPSASDETLAAVVDEGIDEGGQRRGAVLSRRTHPWETCVFFAVALLLRCNTDASWVPHLPPSATGTDAELAASKAETRLATAAATHYILCYRESGT